MIASGSTAATLVRVPATLTRVTSERFDPRSRPEAPRLPGDDFDVPFEEAIAWARERRAVLPDVFYGSRLQAVRARSFAIAGLAALDQVQQVADSLAEATAAGQTFREWQKTLPPDVFALGKARRELIFRNAVQTHYGIGRTIQQRENAAARGFLMWDAINDSRTRPTHRAMDGHIAPIDDPIWKKWTPPAGHRCFLPGTRVRGDFRIGLEAPYSGPAVEVLTSSGARLAVTGNHPVVTSDGWVAAKDIKVGDDLLRYGGVVDPLALAVEDDQQSPPTVEQVFEALACEALGVADPAAFELHGDAQFGKGEVHVAGADGELMHGVQVVRDHRRHQRSFEAACDRVAHGSGHAERSTLVSARAALAVLAQYSLHVPLGRADGLGNDGRTHREQLVQPRNDDRERLVAPIGSAPGGAALALDGVAVALDCGPLHQLGLAASANLRPVPNEQRAHGAADNAGLRGKGLLARAFTVLAQQFGHVLGRPLRSRLGPPPAHGVAVLRSAALDAGIAKQTAEQAVTHGGLFKALTHGFPGEVSTDQVISVRHFTFSGHVYDFETAQGWLVANDVIVSNCRCSRLALTEAQARARGYPKLAPDVEPDAGWEGDPTEGNEDLVRVIKARQQSCLATFAPRRRARGLWCDDGLAGLAINDGMSAIAGGDNRFMTPLRAAWPDGESDVFICAPESAVKGHPNYAAAKLGSAVDAWALVRSVMGAADRASFESLLAGGRRLAAVQAFEGSAVNRIPDAMAQWLAEEFGAIAERSIVQINRVGHTGASGWSRLANQALFDGEVSSGRYVLVDDFVGQGGTLANLRGYILAKGGQVDGYVALTGQARSAKIALTRATLSALRSKHADLEPWWQSKFGFGFDSLTESEAAYLLRVDADTVRNRLSEAGQGRVPG